MQTVLVRLSGFESKEGGYKCGGFESRKATLHISLSEVAEWLHVRARQAMRADPIAELLLSFQIEVRVPHDSMERNPKQHGQVAEMNRDYAMSLSFIPPSGRQLRCERADCPFHVSLKEVLPDVLGEIPVDPTRSRGPVEADRVR